MKYLYQTPTIKVEELIKHDVLCASSQTDTSVSDNLDFSDTDGALRSLFDLRNIM